jgi:hypothetical protein
MITLKRLQLFSVLNIVLQAADISLIVKFGHHLP